MDDRTLLATADPLLLDDLLRLAAAASAEVAVAHTTDRALSLWPHAPLVVVGADLCAALAGTDPPPGRHVVVARETAGTAAALPAGAAPEPPGPGTAAPSSRLPARELLLPRDEPVLVDLFAWASTRTRTPAPTVSVVGGRGGAGASLLAVALAVAGERAGRSTALLDGDPLGCGLDLYLGCDRTSPHRSRRTGWGDLLRLDGRVRWRDLRPGLPGTERVSVLTWARGSRPAGPPPVGAVRAALSSAREGNDLVVADLPRSFDPATTVLLNRSDLVLVVVPADVPSVVAAARALSRLHEEARAVRLVVRGARGELSADVVARSLRTPLGADLPHEPGLARLLAAGDVPARHPRSPLARFADHLVAGLPVPRAVR
ncbi:MULTISPECIES: septum site-determining protein Ssd [unclassified Nocardiopsis]|uniref:septum site-determining protein Ssd n=1 Tax=unclassified Nocardiopsis TaxID=2649073 RepID=UPI00135CE4FF|nr:MULTISPECIES: septum site-determining protein Ssd [unclassified Nocardiopsis]